MSLFKLISGYPGVGKSYLTAHPECVFKDSDSSLFSRENFPNNYMDYIADGGCHFVSSHFAVRAAMKERNLGYLLVYPDVSLREEYIARYHRRNSPEGLIAVIESNWNAWVQSCMDDVHPLVTHCVLKEGQYLSDVVTPYGELIERTQ